MQGSEPLRLFRASLACAAATLALSAAHAGGESCSPEWIPTFDGPVGVNDRVHAALVFDDGSGPALYLGGEFSRAGKVVANGVVRWDGSGWSAVGSVADVLALAVFDDGGGPALYAGTILGLARWDGASWSAVPGQPNDKVWALAVHDDGSGPALFAGGEFSMAGGAPSPGVARWNGASWASLAGGTNLAVYALGVHDEGAGPRLFAGGAFTTAGGVAANRIARWDGTSWSALGTGASNEVHALASFDDGSGSKLWVGGTFTSIGGVASSRSARWNGTGFEALGPSAGGDVRAFAVHDDGGGAAIYAGSSSSTFGLLLEWDGAEWVPIGGGPIGAPVRALASFDDGGGPDLYVGGEFSWANFADLNHVARWDGARLSPLGHGPNEEVTALATWDDGTDEALYVGGEFSFVGEQHVGHVARWNGVSWSPLGDGLENVDAPDLCDVRAMCVYDDGGGPDLYVGGSFTTAGGLPSEGIARWDGTSWSAVGGGVDGPVEALVVHDDGSGPALYAAGWFDNAGGVLAPHVARWNGTTWSMLGASFPDDTAYALATWDDGGGTDLYVGGSFEFVGFTGTSRVARWDGASWSPLGAGVAGGPATPSVEALAVHDDGAGPALFVGGAFATAGGIAADRIARWDGASWSPLGLGTSASAVQRRVRALLVHDDGPGEALFVGTQSLTSFDGVITRQLARWDGTAWSALGGGMSGGVSALAVFDDGAGAALYAGTMGEAYDTDDVFLARWGGCDPDLVTFCFGTAEECPCANAGLPGRGCDNAQATGGVELALVAQTTSPNGTTVTGSGFSTMGAPTALVFRSAGLAGAPAPFGDGLGCLAPAGVVRLAATIASGGTSTHAFGHGAMAGGGDFYYQIWYRNNPSAYCTPAAFNLSNGLRISWP